MNIEIINVENRRADNDYVYLRISINYDTEFKSLISTIIKKKVVSRRDIEDFVSKSIQQIILELDEEFDEEYDD